MKAWTLDQLKFAHEMCFPDRFCELWTKHDTHENAVYHLWAFKARGGLLPWIFMHSRRDYANHGFGEILDNMITDLVGDYGAQ